MDTQLPGSAQPYVAPSVARPGNGMAVAALVVGVASLVAAISFVLFPLGLLGGLLAARFGTFIARNTVTGQVLEISCGLIR